MCGIVGLASRSPVVRRDLLVTMRDTLRHRGPDDAGEWWLPDGRVGFAHRRLAVVDLSPGGHQPMQSSSGRLCITFNGEIYNHRDVRRTLESCGHRFRTASDTEVILEAYSEWGVDCLSRLNGAFAFGLYDYVTRQLFLARDRAGEKPLFYSHTPGRLVFASELKALMADPSFPRALDLAALEHYLAYGYVPGEMCILKGVRKLGQGQAMTYDLETDALHPWRYWQLPEPSPSSASADELAEELEALLEGAVRRQLAVDVPVGILLSGGVDSSLVTAMAARVSPGPVRTFTISFPGHGVYDEAPYARLVAEHFGTQHTELVAEPSAVELLPELARQYDEPMADSSMVPTYLISRLVRQHTTVALGGDGGDELFGGYPHYSWILRQEHARRFIPRPLRRLAGMARWLPPGLKGRNHLIGLTADLAYSIAHINMYFDGFTRHRLLAPVGIGRGGQDVSPETYKAGLCLPGHTLLQQATRADFQTTMVDAYLVKMDRASMLASLEVHAPWLDHQIIEFAFGRVPDMLRATDAERKILPRCLAQRLLPAALDLKRKQGLSMPLAVWFKGRWGSFVESVLCEADPGLFDQRTIRSLIVGQRRGYANTQRLFALAMFELWRREYGITL